MPKSEVRAKSFVDERVKIMTETFEHFHKAVKSGNARAVVEILRATLEVAIERDDPIYINDHRVYSFKDDKYSFHFFGLESKEIFNFNLQQGVKFTRLNATTLGIQKIAKPTVKLQVGGQIISDKRKKELSQIANLRYQFSGEHAAILKDCVDALSRHPLTTQDPALTNICNDLKSLVYPHDSKN